MLYQTIPIVKQKLLLQLKAKTFQERDKQSQQNQPKSLTMAYIILQKIQPQIRMILQKYFSKITILNISNCDLRTFQNFPYLPFLKQFDASKNGLQGTFQYLVKNRTLQYLDVSDNYIKDPFRLQPLKAIRNLTFCLKGNPVLNQNNNNLVKNFGGRIIKQPKKKESIKDEKQDQKQKQKQNDKNLSDQELVKKKSQEQKKNQSDESDQIIEPNINIQMRKFTHDKQGNSIKIRQPRFQISNLAGKIKKKILPQGQLARMFLQRQRLRKQQQQLQKQILIFGNQSDFVIRVEDQLQIDQNQDNEDQDDEQDDDENQERQQEQIEEQQIQQERQSPPV